MRLAVAACVLAFALAGCGGGALPSRAPTASGALTSQAELLELETTATRQDLFKEISRASLAQQGKAVKGPVLFPVVSNGEVVAAPGFEARADLFQAPDSGHPLQLSFEPRGERWSEERRDSLQGLSEREASELVARTLISQWGLHPTGVVQVERASGAPYAVAYVDGILRVNPAFLYMAAAALQ